MTPRYRFQDENGYWHCETCGSLVAVRSFHDAWHERLDRTVVPAEAVRANRAAW